jgi:hypothetical protein
MNFKRPILILLLLCMALAAGLVATDMLRPSLHQRVGRRLFSIDPEAVVTMQCDVKDESGAWCSVSLKRDGSRWSFVSPYRGMMCDVTAITKLLSLGRQMRVTSIVGPLQETNFHAQQYLTFTTVEKSYTCGFNLDSEMTLQRAAVAVDEEVVTIEASALKALPKTVSELRSRALLPFLPEDYILEMTWSEEGAPFMRAARLPQGDWEVTQADVFKKAKETIAPVLEALVKKDLIAAYVYASDDSDMATGEHISTEVLMKYGLDVENARLSVRVRGVDDPIVFSFGKRSTVMPGFVYCLMHGSQSIVLVPEEVRDFFKASGPFAVDYTNLPLVEKRERPTTVDVRSYKHASYATYVYNGARWENKILGLAVDPAAMAALLEMLTTLRGDVIAIQQPAPTDVDLQVTLHYGAEERITLLFVRDESGDMHVYCSETKRLYALPEDAIPEALLSETFAYDVLEKTALRLDPLTIQRVTIERPGAPTMAIARDDAVTGGWRTLQPAGGFVDLKVLEGWLKHFAWMPAEQLKVLDGRASVLAPWGVDASGSPRYTLKIVLDLDGSAEGLRNTLIFAPVQTLEMPVPMQVQGRLVEYTIAPEIVADLMRSPFVYEDR